MSKGRPPKPTVLKRMAGTDQPCRVNENEMQVSVLANIPAPPYNLNEYGSREYEIVCSELASKRMLHLVDLALVTAYANEMGLYVEMEEKLKTTGRIDEYFNEDGGLIRRQAKPEQKIANDSLAKALKIACQFGLTPSARTRITQPEIIDNTFKL
jgi:P27 family predicted phage terminase small subunit